MSINKNNVKTLQQQKILGTDWFYDYGEMK